MDDNSYLDNLNTSVLTAPVRCALQNDTAEVLDWEIEQIGGGIGNPVSVGLYRITGHAQAGGQTVDWSLILKIIQSPANVGAEDMGEGPDQTHWNYWKRELYVYQSGLLDHLPPGLDAPHCYGLTELPGDIAWLWLEEIHDEYQGDWPLMRYILAARHLSLFNSAYLTGQPLPDVAWLSRNFTRQWLTGLPEWLPLFFAEQEQENIWDSPLMQRLYPPSEAKYLRFLLADPERVIEAVEKLPHTLCHLDTYPTNFMSRHNLAGEELTVAVDWALLGIGPVGSDLAQLIFGAYQKIDASQRDVVDEALFKGYMYEMYHSGSPVTLGMVRLGLTISMVMRVGVFGLVLLQSRIEEALEEHPDTPLEESIEITEQQVDENRFMLAMAKEACSLVFSR
jgi:hypothetical protein